MGNPVTIKNIEKKIKYMEESIKEIDKVEDKKDKTILLLCMLDSYSQLNVFCNAAKNIDKFKQFILDFYPADFWDEIGFVNLLEEKGAFTSAAKKAFKLRVKKIMGSNINGLIDLKNNNDIKDLISDITVRLNNPRLEEKFKYINLFYKYRNKLIHNYAFPGYCDDLLDEEFPRYISIYSDMHGVKRDFYDLVFPYEFVKKLTFDSIKNYLSKCLSKRKSPYSKFKVKLTWYEE